MNEEQQRIAIAEVVGVVWERLDGSHHPYKWMRDGVKVMPYIQPPDYLNDRGSIISALSYLPEHKIEEFGEELLTILLLSGEIKDYPVTLPAECGFREIRGTLDLVLAIVKSTPQQLAEAFLRTLVLWKD